MRTGNRHVGITMHYRSGEKRRILQKDVSDSTDAMFVFAFYGVRKTLHGRGKMF